MPSVKRAALYLRVSTLDQHPETQIYDLQQMAVQRDYQIVAQYTDRHLNPAHSVGQSGLGIAV